MASVRILPIIFALVSLVYTSVSGARDTGYGTFRLTAAGVEIKVFTYRPPGCESPSILFVFHGLNRKAESLRDKSVSIARHACLMVFAPLFDKDRFPNWKYHWAGVVREGQIQPSVRWTAPIVHDLLDLARKHMGKRKAKLYMFGHSAGGQFLSRIAAYSPPQDVDRIVIANPSVYVAPLPDEPVPYGFEELFESAEVADRIKLYLALPITIYVGTKDTGDRYLVQNDAAMEQGGNRLERGRWVYKQAVEIAQRKGWTLNWRLVEAQGVGHSSRGMLGAPELIQALGVQDQTDTAPSKDAGLSSKLEVPSSKPESRPSLNQHHLKVSNW